MNVFLAGKVDEQFGSWRDSILGVGLSGSINERMEREPMLRDAIAGNWWKAPKWAIYVHPEELWDHYHSTGEQQFFHPWTPSPRAVLGIHTYTGPYRQVITGDGLDHKHSGYFHGITAFGQHGQMDEGGCPRIVNACRQAIERSDMVFAFINSPDAYGTVAEIGYAVALGKFVSVYVTEGTPFDWDDFWYVGMLATHEASLYEDGGDAEYGGTDGRRALRAFKDALVAYTAWEPPRTILPAIVTREDRSEQAIREIARSFQQIARWTSDPRVRGEARRMLNALGVSG